MIPFLINTETAILILYVAAGFWAGLTIGRFVLAPPALKYGERPFMFALVAGAVAFQLLVWLVPSIVDDAGESVPITHGQ